MAVTGQNINIPFSPPDISDSEAEEVTRVLKSGWITTGPKTKEFEKKIAEYCNTESAVCLSSATAALELILRILGIGKGDEVITSAYTYTASASVIYHTGAEIVFADTAPDSFEMDYDMLESAVTEKTKAVIAVDIGGVICDYDKIFEIAERKKNLFHPANEFQRSIGRIAVIADAAHAFGAKRGGKMCGGIADFTSFSFHAVKNLTTAEGGAAVWRGIEGIGGGALYKEFQLMSLHGQSKDALAKITPGIWEYDIVYPAYKCNMTDIMAGIGLKQFERYPKLMERRHEIIKKYDGAFRPQGVRTLEHTGCKDEYISSGHLYLARIPGITPEKRNDMIVGMAEKGVSCNVHYKPLPMMTAYKNLGFDIKNYPNAYSQFANEITLPLHTKLSDGDVDYVIAAFSGILKSVK